MKDLKTNAKDHVQGVDSATLELIDYADYQCSHCRKAYYIIKEIQEELGKDFKFVFRNFPLTDLHPNALHAAVATEIADSEGKFWKMHDILFENQKYLQDSDLLEYAGIIGIDTTMFENAFEDITFYRKIEEDYKSGVQNGVNGTPTFFINKKKFEGDWTDSGFVYYLKSLLDK